MACSSAAFFVALAVACQANPEVTVTSAIARPRQILRVYVGDLTGLAWVSRDRIVTSYFSDESSAPARLWTVAVDGSHFKRIHIPEAELCGDQIGPTKVAPNVVGFLYRCNDDLYVFRYDFGSKKGTRLVHRPVPDLGFARFTWNTSLRRGLIAQVSSPCVSIAGLTPTGIQLLPIAISEDGRKWDLDRMFRGDKQHVCGPLGNATWPTLSSSGRFVAFFATSAPSSPDSGFNRIDWPWNLYIMDPNTQEPKKVLERVSYPGDLRWSPDGRWLAFSGKVAGRLGAWLFSPEGQRLVLFSPVALESLDWSPDGNQIAGIPHPEDTDDFKRHLLDVFDVSAVTRSS
ncbi:MAG TPA: hypothetical protein VF660_06240 [Actinomycetota bacterium]|jgi:hypothetical protein